MRTKVVRKFSQKRKDWIEKNRITDFNKYLGFKIKTLKTYWYSCLY